MLILVEAMPALSLQGSGIPFHEALFSTCQAWSLPDISTEHCLCELRTCRRPCADGVSHGSKHTLVEGFEKWYRDSCDMNQRLTMDKNQLDGLLALKLVAEKRNFTAAAEALGISPPAISKMIKQLEQRIGVALLYRTSRSTRLTEAGERFLAHAGPALDQILFAFQAVGTYAEQPSGLLRINMPNLVFTSFMEPIVHSFLKKYPAVTLEVFLEDQQFDMVESGFDAAIRVSDILAKDMVAIKVQGPIRWVTAGSPKYFNTAGRPQHPQDLLAHNCLRVRIGNHLYDRWEYEHKDEAFRVQVKGSFIVNDWVVMTSAALEGAGVIYTTEDAIRDKVKTGTIEIVLHQFAPTSSGFYLYYPQRSQVLPKLRAFIDHVKAQTVG
jgi:DNA-binding transcriptional LysR family regulator